MEINRPDIIREVREAFGRYETALMAWDAEELIEAFWNSGLAIRVGGDEVLYGIAAIAEYRRRGKPPDLQRRLARIAVTAFGEDVATVYAVSVHTDSGRTGRQSQTWIRTQVGWKIANAHLSWPAH